jgi:hypothetical protein
MTRHFADDGLSFNYPETWRLEREDTDDGWTVLLQSPGTAFMTVTLDNRMPLQEQVVEETLETLRSDYPALEAETCIDTLAGQMAVGHDIHFFSLDLTNTCWTRCFYTDYGTVLVLCQANDMELDTCEPQFRAVCASLRVETDDA